MRIDSIKPGALVIVQRSRSYSSDYNGVSREEVLEGKGGVLGEVVKVGRYRMQIQGACGERAIVESPHSEPAVVVRVPVLTYDQARKEGLRTWQDHRHDTSVQYVEEIFSPGRIHSFALWLEKRHDRELAAQEYAAMQARRADLVTQLAPYYQAIVRSLMVTSPSTRDGLLPSVAPSNCTLLLGIQVPEGTVMADHLPARQRKAFLALQEEAWALADRLLKCRRP